jgi:hypothetical protein
LHLTIQALKVYTSKFAKRFGMPQEWVDDELKGAEALAYRLDSCGVWRVL